MQAKIFRVLRNNHGQNLVSVMVAVGLIAILALFASTAVSLISDTLRNKEANSRLDGLDQDIANLLVLPPLCTCNMRGLEFDDPSEVLDLDQLRHFSDPPKTPNEPSCTSPDPVPVVAIDQKHESSGHTIKVIRLGPFHPLGDSGNYIADFTVGVDAIARPLRLKLMLATKPNGAGGREIQFCGHSPGSRPAAPPAAYASNTFYRYTQMSLNFGCPEIPVAAGDPPIPNRHPNQIEPYIMMRNQYFWPAEEKDMLTEFESARFAGNPVSPTWFASFTGATTCFEERATADSVRLIVPAGRASDCGDLADTFLNSAATIIDVGFSLVDQCQSRFF